MANVAQAEVAGAKITTGWLPGIEGVVTQIFGVFETVFGINAPHTGIDVGGMPSGSPFAVPQGVTGVVSQAGWNNGFGNSVTLRLPDGTTILGGHLQDVAVQVGQAVNPGDLLGHVDSTGNSTGTHLHFEVRQGGKPVDPWAWLVGAAAAAGAGVVAGQAGPPTGLPFKNPLDPVGTFFNNVNKLTRPPNWWRVLFVAGGVYLIIWGVSLYFFQPAVSATVGIVGGGARLAGRRVVARRLTS